MTAPLMYIVVPCYNEEEALPESVRQLVAFVQKLESEERVALGSRITLVDDGSRDGTWALIERLSRENACVEGIKLAHNVGHQNALWAGLMTVKDKADVTVSIDADLQDDIQAIYGFLDHYQAGCDVVYGVRANRESDTAFKRITAQGFYKFMGWMGVKTVYNHADYRLLSKRALEALAQFGEVNLFLRGMVTLLGFKTAQVGYERKERMAGESKYPLNKMVALAMEGITSFSTKPIRWVAMLGALFALLGVVMALYSVGRLIAGHTVAGWTSIMVSVWLIGGVQLIALGLIGEYVGKIYVETKHRPRFILEEYLEK